MLQPADCRDVAIIPLTKSVDEFSTLMIMRRENLGPYVPAEVETIQALTPHFQRAAAIAELLNFKPLAEHRRGDTLDLLSAGIILTDAKGKIVRIALLKGCSMDAFFSA